MRAQSVEDAGFFAIASEGLPERLTSQFSGAVADEKVAGAIRDVAARALPETAAAMKLFTDINEAEGWLGRPLDQIP